MSLISNKLVHRFSMELGWRYNRTFGVAALAQKTGYRRLLIGLRAYEFGLVAASMLLGVTGNHLLEVRRLDRKRVSPAQESERTLGLVGGVQQTMATSPNNGSTPACRKFKVFSSLGEMNLGRYGR
jgi:hypothetical protein